MTNRVAKSHFCMSILAMIGGASFVSEPAAAQDAVSAAPVESITVTGTSIRGITPIGSNVVTVDSNDIAATGAVTIEQVLATVPQLSGFGSSGQGEFGGTFSNYFTPSIHDLGSSASNSTLTLIDGHRLPLGGISHPLSDPNVIPAFALERVEVLADGSSSVYGSDAVAGVVNFITISQYDGLKLSLQGSIADGYSGRDANLLWGQSWGGGSAIFAYGYSYRSNLPDSDRSWLANPNDIPEGGTNHDTFNCSPASIQPKGSSTIFLSASATTSVANTAANSPCNNTAYADALPIETRQNMIAKITQNVGNNLTAHAELVYSVRADNYRVANGTVTATVFQSGAEANPFYQIPAGCTGACATGATSESVEFDADGLLPQSYNKEGSNNGYVDANLEYRLGKDWRIVALVLAGQDYSYSNTFGGLCTSCADLALNGTTNGSGSTTAPSIPGTSTIVLNLPLTTANALDVWDPPGATNKTSAAVLSSLSNSYTSTLSYNTIDQFRLSADGTLFDLAAGPAKLAGGVEYLHYGLVQTVIAPNNTGIATTGSAVANYNGSRSVESFYGEIETPIVGGPSAIPFVQKIDADISARYDNYSDVGSTFNPKFAVNWNIVEGLRIFANASTSFVAPGLVSLGNKGTGTASFSTYSAATASLTLPIANFPLATQLPGCAGVTTSCVTSPAVTGLSINTGNHNLVPQKGRGWSVGIDVLPALIQGFNANVTLWNAELNGGVGSVPASFIIDSAAGTPLNSLLQIYPNGATPAQIAAATANVPQKTALPATVYYIENIGQQNLYYLSVQGLDVAANYGFSTSFGDFILGDHLTEFLKYNQHMGLGGTEFSVLNTSGFNGNFPSIQTNMRANVGWNYGGFETSLFLNFTGSYRYWASGAANPVIDSAAGVPTGGGDRVHSNTTFDGHMAYNFASNILGDAQVFVDAHNIFNKAPPFVNVAAGEDRFAADPIGRLITVGIKAQY